MDKVIITLAAIISITVLEAFALYQHINGTILAGAIALIAGLGGYTVAKKLKK